MTAVVLLERLGLREVRLVPSRTQPLKERHAVSAEHRVRMVELAVEAHSGLAVERAEVDRPPPSYTVDTLRALSDREPGTSWVLLVGSDAAEEFGKWREPEAIRSLARVVFFSRAGGEVSGETGTERIDVPVIDISATEVRDRARAGRSLRYWVPEAVAEYIAANRLYQDIDG